MSSLRWRIGKNISPYDKRTLFPVTRKYISVAYVLPNALARSSVHSSVHSCLSLSFSLKREKYNVETRLVPLVLVACRFDLNQPTPRSLWISPSFAHNISSSLARNFSTNKTKRSKTKNNVNRKRRHTKYSSGLSKKVIFIFNRDEPPKWKMKIESRKTKIENKKTKIK